MQKNKTLLISGGSTGLGLEVVNKFLEKSWQVILLSRTNNTEIKHTNLTILNCSHNIESLKKNEDKIVKILESGIDLLINNAAYALVGPVEFMTDDQLLNQIQVNFLAHVYLTKMVLPYLRLKQGKIFNVSSVFGGLGCPFYSMYCASKYAMEGFSESMYYELKPHGIDCSIIVPGRYHTSFGKNMDIAEANKTLINIYNKQYQWFFKTRQQLASKKANSPTEFANKLYKIANKKNGLPVRIAIDLDSKIPYLLKRYLPTRIFYYMINLIFNKFSPK